MVCSLVFLEVVVTPNCNNIIREKIKFKMKRDSCQVGIYYAELLASSDSPAVTLSFKFP